jgi:hypothetical protein
MPVSDPDHDHLPSAARSLLPAQLRQIFATRENDSGHAEAGGRSQRDAE